MFATRKHLNPFGRDPLGRDGFVHDRRQRSALLPSNDNRTTGRAAASLRRAARPILMCRWHRAPSTGALEAVWQIETAEAPAADKPPSCGLWVWAPRACRAKPPRLAAA
jgi:hypothetical protein